MSSTRKLGVLVLLACAFAQPAVASAPFANALLLALHGDDHGHAVSVVQDEGHLHVVLSHDDGDAHPAAGLSHHRHVFSPFGEGDHVLHVDDEASAVGRRAVLDPSPLHAIATALPLSLRPVVVAPLRPESRARGTDLQKTVVLRL